MFLLQFKYLFIYLDSCKTFVSFHLETMPNFFTERGILSRIWKRVCVRWMWLIVALLFCSNWQFQGKILITGFKPPMMIEYSFSLEYIDQTLRIFESNLFIFYPRLLKPSFCRTNLQHLQYFSPYFNLYKKHIILPLRHKFSLLKFYMSSP